MQSITWVERRRQLENYFDRTAVDAWSRLTSDVPVSRIRATVRAGRDRMRSLLLSWLPTDLSGCSLLDAGCGTGALATEAAARGARVVAVDLSPTLVELARARKPRSGLAGSVEFRVGDMLDAGLGSFDYVVAMDSLIHYAAADTVRALATLAPRVGSAVLMTFAPRTPALTLMHSLGKLFPAGDRAPAIEPVTESELLRRIGAHEALQDFRAARSERVASGFYTSQALEVVRR